MPKIDLERYEYSTTEELGPFAHFILHQISMVHNPKRCMDLLTLCMVQHISNTIMPEHQEEAAKSLGECIRLNFTPEMQEKRKNFHSSTPTSKQ